MAITNNSKLEQILSHRNARGTSGVNAGDTWGIRGTQFDSLMVDEVVHKLPTEIVNNLHLILGGVSEMIVPVMLELANSEHDVSRRFAAANEHLPYARLVMLCGDRDPAVAELAEHRIAILEERKYNGDNK